MTAILEERALFVVDDCDDDLDHIVCCDEDVSLCGQDMSQVSWANSEPDERVCVVCVELEAGPCSPGCPND